MTAVTKLDRRDLTEREQWLLQYAERDIALRREQQLNRGEAQATTPAAGNKLPWIVVGVVVSILGCVFMLFSFSSWMIGVFVDMARDQAAMSHEVAMAAVQAAPAKAVNAEGGIVLGVMLALAAIFIIIGILRR